jgi:excisionase family DNA binding protein
MSMTTTLTEFVTAEEVAELLGVHVHTVRRWAAENWLPAPLRLGPAGRWLRWRRSAIERFLQQQEERDAPSAK